MADRDTIVAMITMGDTATTVERLVHTLERSIETHRGPARVRANTTVWSVLPEAAMTPRDAFFASHETVPCHDAVGRVSAELIAPYPPGIPAIAPGEVITAETLEMLRAFAADGGRVAYAADPALATLQVVAR
jgi:lysine decarboxylase